LKKRKENIGMWKEYNPSPVGAHVGDCAVRAIAKVLDTTWEKAYLLLVVNGLAMGDMPSANNVIGSVLRQHGFKRANIPSDCPDCLTIKEFCKDNPQGTFVIGTGTHVVAVESGNYFDAWNSGNEYVSYVWYLQNPPIFYI
jgi:hypothetical protein